MDFIGRSAPWLILFLPLAGFTVLSLFGDWIKKDKEENGAGMLACVLVLLSFGLAIYTALYLPSNAQAADMAEFRAKAGLAPRATPYLPFEPWLGGGMDFNWIDVGALRIPFALLLDRLSVVMILVVTGVGSLIHIYSLGYMAHDEERVRYFSYLNLFTFFMLVLVMASSLPLMFVGWEGVGLCSYLLIGFWFKKKSASDAGKKAFIVNRIGDVGLILGMILAFHTFGTLDFVEITDGLEKLVGESLWQFGPLTAIALLLFVGACGKSAQLPLHVWLPDAMEGPTPVSALIHAATMVTAGVYMVTRLSPLYMRSATAMAVVAVIGATTALVAATVALVQTDIKKVLAYSTVSQLGYMFLACGVGAFGVGVFHLVTHAFFKALLFLGSGSVIHAMSGEQDMRKMGGLWAKIPVTFWTFVIGTAAIAGIPFLAGFYSKDEILAATVTADRRVLFGVGLFTALLTAFYMARLLFMTFFGRFRGDHETEHHVHESPWSMLLPLLLLAAGCFVIGHVHVPEIIAPVLRLPAVEEAAEAPWWVSVAAVFTAFVGIVGAFYLYVVYTMVPARIASTFGPLYRLFEAKYYFDDVYNWFASRVIVGGSTEVLWKGVDDGLLDATVNGTGSVALAISRAVRLAQTGLVRMYALVILGGAVTLLGYLLWVR